MSIARKWVFPIIRLVIFAAIAVALVKIAFLADPATPDAAVPTGEIVEPQIAVAIGTIQNDVTLTGTVAATDAVTMKATLSGEVVDVHVKVGDKVKKGDDILDLKGEVIPPEGKPYFEYETVKAKASGVISSLGALEGQTFAVGDEIGKIAPPTFTVSGTIAPEQQYRLLEQPESAEVTITGGPAPFACTDLTITAPVAGATEGDTSPTVRCKVPSDVKVFAGLSAQMVLAGGIAENVLVAPLTAVEGAAGTGNVYVMLPDGTSEARPVTLGLNDGINVEITGGVAEGDMILQFIPGAPAVDGGMPTDGCFDDGQGNVICGDVVK